MKLINEPVSRVVLKIEAEALMVWRAVEAAEPGSVERMALARAARALEGVAATLVREAPGMGLDARTVDVAVGEVKPL